MKALLLSAIAASLLLAEGQIDGALFSELEQIASEQETRSDIRPETFYYEAEGMDAQTQIEEASGQVQSEAIQHEVSHHFQYPTDITGGDYYPPLN